MAPARPAFNAEHPAMGGYYLQNVLGDPLETTVARRPAPMRTLAMALEEGDLVRVAERNAAHLFSIPAADQPGSHRGSR